MTNARNNNKMIRVQELRKRTQLSAQRFGDLYEIPMRTIQDWERGVRTAPEYVINLLERAVNEDFPRTWKVYDAGSVQEVLGVDGEDNFPGQFKNYKEVAAALNKGYGYDETDDCFFTEDDVIRAHEHGYAFIYPDGVKVLYL